MIEPIINTAPTGGSGLLNFFTAYFHRLGQLVMGGTFNVNFLPQMSNKSSKLGPSSSITKALYFPQGPDKYILETPEFIYLVPTPKKHHLFITKGSPSGVNKKPFACLFQDRQFQHPDRLVDRFRNFLLVIDSFGQNRCKKYVLKPFCILDQRNYKINNS